METRKKQNIGIDITTRVTHGESKQQTTIFLSIFSPVLTDFRIFLLAHAAKNLQ